MAFSKIRPRGDTKSKWEAANPVLLEREIGVEWENTIGVGEVNIKFGDGVKHWNELDYAVVSDIKKKIISSFAEVTAENPALEEGSTLDLLWAVTKKKFEYLNIQINGIKTMIGAFSNITVESGGVDQAAADITNAIQLLNSGKLSTADIYNGLDSTNALLALSALQGHDLNSKIEKLNGDLSLNVSNANLIDTILPILDTIGKTCSGFFRETTDLTTQAQGYAYGFTAYRIHEKAIRVMANRVYSGIIELYDYEIDKNAWSYKGSLDSSLGTVIQNSKSVAAVKGSDVQIATITLPANHKYLILAHTGTSISDSASIMSCSIKKISGENASGVGFGISRATMNNGGGCTVWGVVDTATSCVYGVYGYGYSSAPDYNYIGDICAIQLS